MLRTGRNRQPEFAQLRGGGITDGSLSSLLLCFMLIVGSGFWLTHASKWANAQESPAAKDQPGKTRVNGSSEQPKGDSEQAEQPDKLKAGDKVIPPNPFPNRVKLPDGMLEGGTEWLNTTGEIRVKDLRGKVVLLDFWTYCCINCIHTLPDLKYLEKKFPNELVVIGVHSAKFDNEKDSENIRRAIQRYEIEHPVVNDANMTIWRKFGTRSWPTLALIDPEGYFCGRQPGEGHRQLFETVIQKLVDHHDAKGTLDETPIRFDLEREKMKETPLLFPSKVLADGKGGRLFISDSNHNRIIIATLNGKLLDVVGNGQTGNRNGSYDEAMFDHPQGMVLVKETLYVADTENHSIRMIDLKKKKVATLAGTGSQARHRFFGGNLKTTALASPWALEHVDGVLYICMAGPHQLWSHKLGSNRIETYAGNGREDIINGSRLQCEMAQPSGIISDGKYLYVCDSEGSSIRKIPLDDEEDVTTIAGTFELPRGASLFTFGDKDGVGPDARLQHPLGITFDGTHLYVADSYNHKIRKLTLQKKFAKVETLLGNGTAGDSLQPLKMSEPHGITWHDGTLIIADTNNHRLLKHDLKTGKTSRFEIDGLKPPKKPKPKATSLADAKDVIRIELQELKSGEELKIVVSVNLPAPYKLNKLAPVIGRMELAGKKKNSVLIHDEHLRKSHRGRVDGNRVSFSIPLKKSTGEEIILLGVNYIYCRDGVGGLCKFGKTIWEVPIQIKAGGKPAIELQTPKIVGSTSVETLDENLKN